MTCFYLISLQGDLFVANLYTGYLSIADGLLVSNQSLCMVICFQHIFLLGDLFVADLYRVICIQLISLQGDLFPSDISHGDLFAADLSTW